MKKQKAIKNSLGDLKDKVVPASEIVTDYFKEKQNKTVSMVNKLRGNIGEVNDQISTKTDWITQIEDYCGANGVTPSDLIEAHSKLSKSKIKPKIASNEEIRQRLHKENAVGKPYNPMNNPLYKAKMASKSKFRQE